MESSDDDVFCEPNPNRTIRNKKLRRRNAIRRPRERTNSEPRVTREMLHSNRYSSISAPTTPSNVDLLRRQNLVNILRPRNPIVPEVVNMDAGTVQTVNRVLEHQDNHLRLGRRSRLRAQARVDYVTLHNKGRSR